MLHLAYKASSDCVRSVPWPEHLSLVNMQGSDWYHTVLFTAPGHGARWEPGRSSRQWPGASHLPGCRAAPGGPNTAVECPPGTATGHCSCLHTQVILLTQRKPADVMTGADEFMFPIMHAQLRWQPFCINIDMQCIFGSSHSVSDACADKPVELQAPVLRSASFRARTTAAAVSGQTAAAARAADSRPSSS